MNSSVDEVTLLMETSSQNNSGTREIADTLVADFHIWHRSSDGISRNVCVAYNLLSNAIHGIFC
jgi:hypothetical protein